MIKKVADFKDRLNEALSLKNMKPVELAEKTKISESTISQYRSGYAKPREEKLALIADALDVSPTWLMGLDVPMKAIPVLSDKYKIDAALPVFNEGEDIAKAIDLYKAYSSASPDVRSAIEILLKSHLSDS